MNIRLICLLSACTLRLQMPAAHASETILSATKLTFGDSHTLFIADWKAARIHALIVAAPAAAVSKPFNLREIQQPIADALHVNRSQVRFEDMAVQPGTELAYLALTIQHGRGASTPALVTIDATGAVALVNLKAANSTSVAITDEPSADKRFWRAIPEQSLTVTDMKFYQGKLYVAGLSDRTFASTLRVYDFPFAGVAGVSTIEMYHPVHNQVESRAPIREMSFLTLNGQPTLIAAYTCTPLVAIPLGEIKDGAHITARTIGELGWGSAPVGLVTFELGGTGYALLVNSSRAADLLTFPALAEAVAKPGLNKPIKWPAEPYEGVRAVMVPLSAVDRLDNLNQNLLIALRRDPMSGDMELVTIPKGAYLRLSDFVNEYDFTDYQYPASDPFHEFHKMARALEGYPELVR